MPLVFALAAAAAATSPGAAACSPAAYAALTAPKDTNEKPYVLSCSVTLKKGDNIPRRILLLGGEATGVQIDCNGGDVGYKGIVELKRGNGMKRLSPFDNPTIMIATKKKDDYWSTPSGISIRRCNIHGNLRTSAVYYESLLSESRKPNFTRFLQKNAPHSIKVSDSSIIGYQHIPLYIGPGTTEFIFENSRISGNGEAAIYFDLESGKNIIKGNNFDIKTEREIVAVDGSANNVISNNLFRLYRFDAIHLYRNCGESGIIRHQSPSGNIIYNNKFYSEDNNIKMVVVNSRTGKMGIDPARSPKICDLDKGFKFGSSKNDDDEGKNNSIRGNKYYLL
ncbi:right-handed parallel beta-helix repeat-containing protein [Sphingobium sp. MP9-4]|uniref:right-handed parallel beta-helix repeat-containing protein n=1 Tax=Sphingobium sp. MP9-4 TaxID=1761936 RepID=UPI0010CA844A|nr:right-handed parallel beta-helix repeat-containing protein [Sphingobium sp. MP9-4]